MYTITRVLPTVTNRKALEGVCVENVKLMLDYGCFVNERDSKGRTPLHTAVNAGRDNPDE